MSLISLHNAPFFGVNLRSYLFDYIRVCIYTVCLDHITLTRNNSWVFRVAVMLLKLHEVAAIVRVHLLQDAYMSLISLQDAPFFGVNLRSYLLDYFRVCIYMSRSYYLNA